MSQIIGIGAFSLVMAVGGASVHLVGSGESSIFSDPKPNLSPVSCTVTRGATGYGLFFLEDDVAARSEKRAPPRWALYSMAAQSSGVSLQYMATLTPAESNSTIERAWFARSSFLDVGLQRNYEHEAVLLLRDGGGKLKSSLLGSSLIPNAGAIDLKTTAERPFSRTEPIALRDQNGGLLAIARLESMKSDRGDQVLIRLNDWSSSSHRQQIALPDLNGNPIVDWSCSAIESDNHDLRLSSCVIVTGDGAAYLGTALGGQGIDATWNFRKMPLPPINRILSARNGQFLLLSKDSKSVTSLSEEAEVSVVIEFPDSADSRATHSNGMRRIRAFSDAQPDAIAFIESVHVGNVACLTLDLLSTPGIAQEESNFSLPPALDRILYVRLDTLSDDEFAVMSFSRVMTGSAVANWGASYESVILGNEENEVHSGPVPRPPLESQIFLRIK